MLQLPHVRQLLRQTVPQVPFDPGQEHAYPRLPEPSVSRLPDERRDELLVGRPGGSNAVEGAQRTDDGVVGVARILEQLAD